MNSYAVRFLSIILMLFLAVYTGYQAYRYFYKPYKTERAINYSITDIVRVKGLVVRDEETFKDNSAGVLSYTATDAEKVTPYSIIGHIYSDIDQASAVQKIKELDMEIASLTQASDPGSLVYTNAELLTSQINEKLGKLTLISATGDSSGEVYIRSELQTILNKKQLVTGCEQGYNDRIDLLKNEREQLIAQVGNDYSSLKSPNIGYFTRYCDGMESKLNFDILANMSNDDLSQFIAGKYGRDESYTGKIVKDHNWYFATIVNKKEAEKFAVGASVFLNFPSKRISNLTATVHSVTPDENKSRVVLKCDYVSADLLSLRSTSAVVSFKTYSGLRVSSRAVRMIDGQTGVYVKTGYNIQFRPINIIYQEADYVICGSMTNAGPLMNVVASGQEQAGSVEKETATVGTNTPLELFDEVIVGGTDIYDGKPLV